MSIETAVSKVYNFLNFFDVKDILLDFKCISANIISSWVFFHGRKKLSRLSSSGQNKLG